MADESNRVRAIFLAAIEQHAPAEWPGFLDEVCAQEPALRGRVERLLQAQARLGPFHENVKPGRAATLDESFTEGPGTMIGPYKLLEQIGEGGFGVVFMAEQTRPVRRKVALKVLKPGMDTRQVVARFEAERQALALMDHPNIAKVLDAGMTPDGRPYFVMELVKGVPITDFCDQGQRTPRQRLELFLPVCSAVQHAHQKGIIHRDLKPSNVLVALYDDRPVAKVIDFGVAKAIGQQLSEHT
jgi:serine/threonine protein kinase